MGTKSEAESLDSYLRVLEGISNLFARGLPPKEALRQALDEERQLRWHAQQVDVQERPALASECGVDLLGIQDHAVELVRAGRLLESRRLVELLDFLFEDDSGVSCEVVRAVTGDAEGATESLLALSQDRGAPFARRRSATNALLQIGELQAHLQAAYDLVKEHAAKHDFGAACDVASDVAIHLHELFEESQAAWGPPQLKASGLN